ncbi:MAG: HlyD family efflux transporter periplasmic adaptor subunit [Verrucomicrobiota bacterium]
MKALTPVPIPAAVRWREFRTRLLPLLVVAGLIGTIAFLWRNHTGQATMQGIGEGVRSNITAPQTVQIQKWLVEPYTVVAAGTPVVVVAPADARADFDRLRSMLDLQQIRSQPSQAEDNAMNFERVRIEQLKTKSELAIARVKLEQAERDVTRNAGLAREKLVSQDLYELAINARDALKAEVEEKTKATAQIDQRLENLRAIGEPGFSPATGNNALLAQLEKAQQAAAKNLEPQTLVAPISGMVSQPLRQTGEFVPAGEPLLTISSARADHVVAYLRQPYRFDPQVGMTAQVTTRTGQRQAFLSQIAQIGAQIEVLTNALAMMRPGQMVDVALPVILPVPPGVNIRPGEIVDILITEPPTAKTTPAAQTISPGRQL